MRWLALLLLLATPAAAQEWQRDGLLWQRLPPAEEQVQEPLVDLPRVQAQMAQGCGATPVAFGDTAGMRGADLGDWPRAVRRQVAAASITTDPAEATARMAAAMQAPGLTQDQLWALETQAALIALQLGDPGPARALRDLPEDAPGQLRADRIFWQAMGRIEGSRRPDWTALSARLAQAHAADPAAFQIRAWRLIAWLGDPQPGACAARVRALGDLALDVSEASACPLMIGHVSHRIDRALTDRADPGAPLRSADVAWRLYTEALLARIVRAERVAGAATASLRAGNGPCRAEMLSALAQLEALP
ncbi:MAG: hypothetical protein ACU0CI_03220 [Shimia sp.]